MIESTYFIPLKNIKIFVLQYSMFSFYIHLKFGCNLHLNLLTMIHQNKFYFLFFKSFIDGATVQCSTFKTISVGNETFARVSIYPDTLITSSNNRHYLKVLLTALYPALTCIIPITISHSNRP